MSGAGNYCDLFAKISPPNARAVLKHAFHLFQILGLQLARLRIVFWKPSVVRMPTVVPRSSEDSHMTARKQMCGAWV